MPPASFLATLVYNTLLHGQITCYIDHNIDEMGAVLGVVFKI